MDLSGLIFVALALAWAAYLIPKALRHHDDVERGRSIDRFSHSMRVLARREPVSSRAARLVETQTRRAAPVAAPDSGEQYALRRVATRRATKRRRRVLGLIFLALAGVVTAAALGRVAWVYVAAPVALLLVWLAACRLMVRKERAWHPVEVLDTADAAENSPDPAATADDATTGSAATDPALWDPVPVTLPTYVSKPPARRSVRTIDLDATGVWTSGRTESDTALAREADAAQASERDRRRSSRPEQNGSEAVGS